MIRARTQFRHLTTGEIHAAILAQANPIAAEVTRLVQLYGQSFTRICEQMDRIPVEQIIVRPGAEIERIAMEITHEAIADTLGRFARRGSAARLKRGPAPSSSIRLV